ncbi:unnamed protein product [Dovyalis caffra]|uniref:Pentatricopeptide repeat-containing protein n=1 Tax=Dovyalis caffra TaxID=77055 RepID=A0AAV1S055_9ROSI|nr:unnamed protein product [Dovyalis caffra]
MVRYTSKKSISFFLRKYRKWPYSPYKARWHRIFSQQQAMQSLKQSATKPPQQEEPIKPHVLSSLIHSFSIYNVEPTPKAYDFIIKTLVKTSQFHYIPSVLDHLENFENFEPPESIFSYLIEVYGSTDKTHEAIELFSRIPKFRCVPSVYSLNTLISVLCRNSKGLNLVPEIMLKSQAMNIRMEESTFQVLITALCRIKKVGSAIEMLNCMVNDGFTVNTEICSMLLSCLCEQKDVTKFEVMGFLEELRKLGFFPGMMDYSNVIRFLVKGKMGVDALHVLNQMKLDRIKPDIFCYTMVLHGMIEDGEYLKADELFDELLLFGLVPDVYTYNVYINGLCEQNNVEAGVKMLASMEELRCKPNLITYNILLKQLCKVGELSKAADLLREMGLKGIGQNMQTYRIMIDGLASNGKIVEACGFFEEAMDKGLLNQSLKVDDIICGLCQRDLSCKALELLEKMVSKNVSPGARAWKSLLLSSGFKLGFVETTLINLVGTSQTQLSNENAAVE